MKNKKTLFWVILSSFLLIPLIVSVISTIHVINFFEISNNRGLAIALSLSFEIGALSALAGLVVLNKINKNVIYFIFILLTMYQMMGNTYYAYDIISQKMLTNPDLIKNWAELFNFDIEDSVVMKRIIAIISGAVLPIVSLCFLDLSVDYIKKSNSDETSENIDDKKMLVGEISEPIEENVVMEIPIKDDFKEVEVNKETPIVEPTTEPIIEPIKEEVVVTENITPTPPNQRPQVRGMDISYVR